jgi:multiple sugar transport system ATP-binding protein
MTALVLRNVCKSFGKVEVLRDIDLAVESGEFIVFVGPSGCGKSTLLRVIAGLEDATSGDVEIEERVVNDVPPAKRGIAMVFQSYALYPHLTARGNMALGLKQEGQSRQVIAERIAKASQMLSLEPYLDRRPSELSGGQRQRVAIGRTIVREPRLFLFDEPLSNLDAALRMNTRVEIANLHRALNATIIYVTHDQTEAMTLADRLVVLRDGRVEQVGAPMEVYNNPANQFVAGFLGSPAMNFLPAGPLGGPAGHILGVRPEYIRIAETGRIGGRVIHVEKLGSDTNILVDAGLGAQITVRQFGQFEIRTGASVQLNFDDRNCHLFNADGRRVPMGGRA